MQDDCGHKNTIIQGANVQHSPKALHHMALRLVALLLAHGLGGPLHDAHESPFLQVGEKVRDVGRHEEGNRGDLKNPGGRVKIPERQGRPG